MRFRLLDYSDELNSPLHARFTAVILPRLRRIRHNKGTFTCPGGSLRDRDEVALDLAWSEMNVFETNFVITAICNSVKRRRDSHQPHEPRVSDIKP